MWGQKKHFDLHCLQCSKHLGVTVDKAVKVLCDECHIELVKKLVAINDAYVQIEDRLDIKTEQFRISQKVCKHLWSEYEKRYDYETTLSQLREIPRNPAP